MLQRKVGIDMSNTQKVVYVYENWNSDIPVKLGTLYVDFAKGVEHYSFEYDDKWLTTKETVYVLDPDLALYHGRQYPMNKNTFGLFADSSPDRWGRMLMKRREKIWQIKKEESLENLLIVIFC